MNRRKGAFEMRPTQELIGKIITEEAGRDAIHIAVLPVTAGQDLLPSDEVGISGDVAGKHCKPLVGIVDPFLKPGIVEKGQRFFIYLFPNTISSLRHVWAHKDIPDTLGGEPAPKVPPGDKAESEAWLREYAKRVNPYFVDAEMGEYASHYPGGADGAYQTLLEGLRSGELVYHGIDMHGREDLIDGEELQRHGSVVLGYPLNFDTFEYFSCTC